MKVIKLVGVFLLLLFIVNTSFSQPPNPCGQAWCARADKYDGTGLTGLWWCCDQNMVWDCPSSCVPPLQNCTYFHLRNITGSPCAGVIKRVEVEYVFHDGQTKFSFCGGFKNFGVNPWTTPWDAKIIYDTYFDNTKSSGDCISTNNETNVVVSFTPPASTTEYRILPANHWTVVLCGAEKYRIRVFYDDGTPNGYECNLGDIQNSCTGCPE